MKKSIKFSPGVQEHAVRMVVEVSQDAIRPPLAEASTAPRPPSLGDDVLRMRDFLASHRRDVLPSCLPRPCTATHPSDSLRWRSQPQRVHNRQPRFVQHRRKASRNGRRTRAVPASSSMAWPA